MRIYDLTLCYLIKIYHGIPNEIRLFKLVHFLPGFDDEDYLDFVVLFYTICFLDDPIKNNRVAINLAIVASYPFFSANPPIRKNCVQIIMNFFSVM